MRKTTGRPTGKRLLKLKELSRKDHRLLES